jgi:hypothetical protein
MKSTIEYQVKRNFKWIFCSCATYLKDKKNKYHVQKRNLKNGAFWSA